jgi:orotate phosphoribosyltransferase
MSEDKVKQYKKRLLQLLKKEALKRGRVLLSSGKASSYYLDGRLITLSAQGAHLLSNIILELIKGKGITAVGGPTLGADPIVGAVISLAAIKGKRLGGFIVRRATKGYGMQRLIEGPSLSKGSRVILVDDVATTGSSLVEAKRALDKEGIIVDCAIVIVDREEGARENLAKVGCRLISLFEKNDIIGGETSKNNASPICRLR